MGFKAAKPSGGTLISRLLVAVLPQYSTIPVCQHHKLHLSGVQSKPASLDPDLCFTGPWI
jgi:hypothetical protein